VFDGKLCPNAAPNDPLKTSQFHFDTSFDAFDIDKTEQTLERDICRRCKRRCSRHDVWTRKFRRTVSQVTFEQTNYTFCPCAPVDSTKADSSSSLLYDKDGPSKEEEKIEIRNELKANVQSNQAEKKREAD
jgi:uncharacterized Zn-finger protein